MARRPCWSLRGGPAALVPAALVLALAAGCTVRARPDPLDPVAAPATTRPVAVRGTTPATRAFTLVRTWPGGRVRPAGAGALPLAMRRTGGEHPDQAVNLLLVFPLLRQPPECVARVELWLRVLSFRHQFRYQEPRIGAYPSRLCRWPRTGRPAGSGSRRCSTTARWPRVP
jgi:hypothetical protein